MKKKLAFIVVLLALVSAPALCVNPGSFTYSIGLDNPFFGMLMRDSNGQIVGDVGVSLGLGISYKKYFSNLKFNHDFDPSKIENFSTYWAIGTFALVLPYAGVGLDYAWENGFYIGAGLLISSAIRYIGPGYMGYVGPEIHGGLMF